MDFRLLPKSKCMVETVLVHFSHCSMSLSMLDFVISEGVFSWLSLDGSEVLLTIGAKGTSFF